jgi:FtsH-binding integral membrane protein
MTTDAKAASSVSIWFFIGLSLLVNGVLILGAGVYEIVHPPPVDHQVVLFQYHASVWWGALLALLGGFYCWHFSPKHGSGEGM